jgi:sortase A
VTLRLDHRTARVIGAVGRTLIGFGIITLLFVAYQLWGTGVLQARSQETLGDEFAARLEATASLRSPTTTEPPSQGSSGRALGTNRPIELPGATASTTTTEPEPIDPEVLAALAPAPGEPVARIQIPSIGVDEVVVYGVGVPDLRKGPGVFPQNPMPGTPGNAAIAGHRTTYGQPFYDLDLIQPGDEIIVSTLRGDFTYLAMTHQDDEGAERGHFIVPETGVWVLDDFGDNRLTLIACHPKRSSAQRIVVTGELLEAPVEPDPEPDPEPADETDEPSAPTTTTTLPTEPVAEWGEGLDGDTGALVPTLGWGALFGLGMLVAWLIGRRWRRWPTYLLSSPVLAWLLWSCFVHLDQLLPSY